MTSLLHTSGLWGPGKSLLELTQAPFPCFWRTPWYLQRILDCLQMQHPAEATPSPLSFLPHVGRAVSNPHGALCSWCLVFSLILACSLPACPTPRPCNKALIFFSRKASRSLHSVSLLPFSLSVHLKTAESIPNC